MQREARAARQALQGVHDRLCSTLDADFDEERKRTETAIGELNRFCDEALRCLGHVLVDCRLDESKEIKQAILDTDIMHDVESRISYVAGKAGEFDLNDLQICSPSGSTMLFRWCGNVGSYVKLVVLLSRSVTLCRSPLTSR